VCGNRDSAIFLKYFAVLLLICNILTLFSILPKNSEGGTCVACPLSPTAPATAALCKRTLKLRIHPSFWEWADCRGGNTSAYISVGHRLCWFLFALFFGSSRPKLFCYVSHRLFARLLRNLLKYERLIISQDKESFGVFMMFFAFTFLLCVTAFVWTFYIPLLGSPRTYSAIKTSNTGKNA
jgi:hypothetical protein